MHDYDEDNDGKFPGEGPVETSDAVKLSSGAG
jgi:hypothetical protein